jgi:hypothetical protein
MNNSFSIYFKVSSDILNLKLNYNYHKMDRLCVLLYSKYSPMSSKLMSALSTCPVDLSTTVGIRPVCIDNEDIRRQILKDKKIEINSVPCVLIAYNTGNVEKYEGSNAFEWIEETVSKYMPKPTPQQQPQIHEPQIHEPQIHQPQIHQEPKAENQKIKKKAVKKETTMEDLGIDSEEIETEEIVRQPVGVRNGPGTYDMSIEFGEQEDQNRNISTKLKASATGKTKDLMATALAMQKERDSGESNKLKSNADNIIDKIPV